ncbi:ATP-binding cassette domain-containing protein [Leptolyngbya sp. FACHB-261]|uniref:ABC transporter ATP-binding protein n=1 Tax=Leptolyngbya sp. FACHB-261 TaxID=2692806 RepID=UPI001683B95D|nr:ATP-binding cassette domain-containing protein [Leptolyngbya sp. FACHB-261]MBD2105260.1 ATP-binding cassette domain-containing protein [Leptolyngbya sp. FACHB-261]
MSSELLRLEQVSLSTRYGSVLQDLSGSVQVGARVALVGRSGAGKTSLLRLLNRLADPSSGAIYLGGQELRQLPIPQVRRQVILVQQETRLLGMTVREAITYPLRLRNLTAKESEHQLQTWVERLSLETDLLERTEVQLSLGERQRVSWLRALVSQPSLLLLDEPFSAQDAGQIQQLLYWLQKLSCDEGMTVILVSHQLEVAHQFCNHLLELQNGRLVQNAIAPEIDWNRAKERLENASAVGDWGEFED